jgi:hypothetical protein
MLIWTIVAVIVVALLTSSALASNSQVRRRNRAREAWSELGAEIEGRRDLVPILAGTLKGFRARRLQHQSMAGSRNQHHVGQA